MVEFALPKNSQITGGKIWPKPPGATQLREFKVYGDVVWGARPVQGSDQAASEWKYVPIRRLALYIESSLYDGTQWVTFGTLNASTHAWTPYFGANPTVETAPLSGSVASGVLQTNIAPQT